MNLHGSGVFSMQGTQCRTALEFHRRTCGICNCYCCRWYLGLDNVTSSKIWGVVHTVLSAAHRGLFGLCGDMLLLCLAAVAQSRAATTAAVQHEL